MASPSKKPLLSRGASSIWSSDRAFKLAPVLALAMFVAACGFTPIHKFDAQAPTLKVAALQVSGDNIATPLRRVLTRRLVLSEDSAWRVDVKLSRSQREVQKTSSGVALRLELRHQALVHIERGETHSSQKFVLTQFMTRGESGADELSQIRALDDLAVRDLSGKILAYLSAQKTVETAP